MDLTFRKVLSLDFEAISIPAELIPYGTSSPDLSEDSRGNKYKKRQPIEKILTIKRINKGLS